MAPFGLNLAPGGDLGRVWTHETPARVQGRARSMTLALLRPTEVYMYGLRPPGEIRVHACTHRPPTRGGERYGARLNRLFDLPRPFTTCQCVCLTETCSPCVGCPTVFLASRRSADAGWVHNM